MRLIVLFDLPVETRENRKEYRKFHKALIKNGFLMIQYSVYSRYCSNDTAADKFTQRINEIRPAEGNVRILRITESQYTNMKVLTGTRSTREKLEKESPLIIVD